MKVYGKLSVMKLFVIMSILCTVVADSCNNSSCESIKMPLVSNNLKTPLFADFDVSALNEQLKDYIDDNIMSTFTKQIEDVVNKKQIDLKKNMLEEYSSKLEKSDDIHGQKFSKMFKEFERRFFNLSENQSKNATKLRSDVQEWKVTLVQSMKEHSGKLQKSEIAYENKLSEILRNYSDQTAKISEEATQNITDLKANIKEWKNNLVTDLVKTITDNLTQFATDMKEWKNDFKKEVPHIILDPVTGRNHCIGVLGIDWMSDVISIQNDGSVVLKYCNYDVDGGGWIVIQRRQDNTDFYRTWSDYKKGFGSLDGSFWLGNDNNHRITSSGRYELRVDLSDWEGGKWYAVYKTFKVENELSKYKLTVSGYSGTAGDNLNYHSGSKFSTMDQDNEHHTHNCAKKAKGGWWYNGCHESNLNGIYKKGKSDYWNVVSWNNARGEQYSLKFARMMIRRY